MGDTPIFLVCPVLRRVHASSRTEGPTAVERARHQLTRTGRTKPNTSHRVGARASRTRTEVRCTCGYSGWTTHVDAAHLARGDR